jgi:SAM-dependent methyltransferase
VLLAELDRGGVHLEAGCGAGFWVAALSAAGYRVEGIDSSAGLVEVVAAAAPELDVRHGDALAIDRPDGHYDSYLSFGVVEHRREGPEPFLAEAHRVLKPGGLLVVSVPHFGPLRRARARPGTPPPGRPFYQYGFTLEELAGLATAAGFTVRRALPIEPHRLLEEESRLYERLAQTRGGTRLKGVVEAACSRFDGHMAVVVANKSRNV